MTPIRAKVVQRETGTVYKGRPLVVELHDMYIAVREKGRKDAASAVTLDYGTLYELMLKVRANAERSLKERL